MWSILQSASALTSALLPLWSGQHEDTVVAASRIGPIADGGSHWREAFKLAEEVVGKMTVEEKVNLTSAFPGPCQGNSGGVPRLGIPQLCYSDGPAGPRWTDFITQWPSEFTAAASFDKDLMEERGRRIGYEFRGKGVNVQLGPVTGGPLGRSPYTGRNWEAFTPDPYLSSIYSYLTIKAMGESGLVTTAKHYMAYEQEEVCAPEDDGVRTFEHPCSISSEVDEKTLHELYLPSFVESVRAGTGSVMCSYNRINGVFSCENDRVLNHLLKHEMDFQGFVMSDFGASHSTVESAMAGMDMELATVDYYGDNLLKAVKKGKVPVERLDDMARRILTPFYAQKQHIDYPRLNEQMINLDDVVEVDGMFYRNEHVDVRKSDSAAYARKVAAESTVLLKNTGVLPLKNIRRISIFGSDADYPPTLSGCGPDLFCEEDGTDRHWHGHVSIGGGSGAAYASYLVPPVEGISRRAREAGMRVDHVLKDDEQWYPAVQKVAANTEVCIVFVSVFQVEGRDRKHLNLDHNGEQLIKEVEGSCGGQVVVVLNIGGQVLVEDWVDLPKMGAVLFAGYPGQESGNAIADILFGDVNPSGKLPFTMGKRPEDWPTNNIVREAPRDGSLAKAKFSEGVAIDYKWFDLHQIKPRYEFGFGLSYTSFKVSDLRMEASGPSVSSLLNYTTEKSNEDRLYEIVYTAKVNVTNTGKKAGAEAMQLYMSFPKSEKAQPPKHLRGIDKLYLEPGQSGVATFHLRTKDLMVWDDVKPHGYWRVPKGEYAFQAGHSSRDLPLKLKIHIDNAK